VVLGTYFENHICRKEAQSRAGKEEMRTDHYTSQGDSAGLGDRSNQCKIVWSGLGAGKGDKKLKITEIFILRNCDFFFLAPPNFIHG
jgi:hypothetical protein